MLGEGGAYGAVGYDILKGSENITECNSLSQFYCNEMFKFFIRLRVRARHLCVIAQY